MGHWTIKDVVKFGRAGRDEIEMAASAHYLHKRHALDFHYFINEKEACLLVMLIMC